MNQIYLLLNRIIDNKKYHFSIFLLLLLCLTFTMIQLYWPMDENFIGHDGLFHIRRFEALMKALKNGTFPIYIDDESINGFGYATKWFYPDFHLIPFAIIGNITSLTFSYKLIIAIHTVLCGVFTYYSIYKIYKKTNIAIIAALLYTFCSYRLIDLFYREALGESLSFTFLPIILLGMHEIVEGNYKKWYILTIGYSMLILSHVLSSFIMGLILLFWLITKFKYLYNEPKRLIYLIISAISTILICAYFLYPILEQLSSNTFGYTDYNYDGGSIKYNGVRFSNFIKGLFSINPPKEFFVPYSGLLLTLGIIARIFSIKNKDNILIKADLISLVGLCLLFMSLVIFPWNIFPFNKLSFMQFPWRLYEFSSLFLAISGSIYLSYSSKKQGIIIISIAVLVVIIMKNDSYSYKYGPQSKPYRNIALSEPFFYLGNYDYFPKKADKNIFLEREITPKYKKVENNITDFKKEKGITTFGLKLLQKDTLELPLLYYKGYSAYLNDKEIEVSQSENGLVEIPVNESGHIKVYYAGTTIQKVSFWVTILSIITLCIYIYVYNRKRKENA